MLFRSLEAIRLKRFAISKEMVSNLFLVVTHTFGTYVFGEGHSISYSHAVCHLLKEKTLKAKLASIGERNELFSRINDIYPPIQKFRETTLKRIPFEYRNIEEWLSLEKFNERVESYVQNYNVLKHKKI